VIDVFARLAVRAISYPQLAVRAEDDFAIDGRNTDVNVIEPAPEPGPASVAMPTTAPPGPAGELDLKHTSGESVPTLIPMPVAIPPSVQVGPAAGGPSPPGARSDTNRSTAATPTGPPPTPLSRLAARRLPEIVEWTTESTKFPTAAAPALRPEAPLPAEPPRRQSEPSAVPARVEVTIDRVEVRVRPPVSPHAHSRGAEPAPVTTLTLEEYLRRRETGS
jgi:hypothetical protein